VDVEKSSLLTRYIVSTGT